MRLQEGDQLTMRDLLYGLLLWSGNDNAVAIAEHVGGDVDTFMEMVNDQAAEFDGYRDAFCYAQRSP